MKLEELKQFAPYKITGLADMFLVPPPEMLIETILPKKTITGLTSYPGVGKTWFTLELARAVATGGSFLGHFKALPGNVVYVGQDASVHDYAQQLRKLLKDEYTVMEEEVTNGVRLFNPFDERLHFLMQPNILLEDRERVKRLAATVIGLEHSEYIDLAPDPLTGEIHQVKRTRTGTDLIVLDTLSKMVMCNQSDTGEMENVFRNLRWLAEATGACIIVIHHNSKQNDFNEGEDWRGALAQIAALDNWFHLNKVPKQEGRILLKVKRFRGLTPENFHFRRHVDETKATMVYDGDPPLEVADITITYDTREAIWDWLGGTGAIGPFYTARQITDGIWPMASEFVGSEKTLYNKVCAALKDAESFEAGPGKVGFRLKEIPRENPE